MPAAKAEQIEESSRSDNQIPDTADAGTAIKLVLEKKIRNLEKRRAKLVQLKEDMEKGKDVHPDQKKAALRITEVDEQLDFSRDMLKNVVSIVQACNKVSKIQQRKENRERTLVERSRLRDLMNLQELLNMLGSEEIRSCFVQGIHGAVLISAEKLALLDYLYQKICPSHDDLAPLDSWQSMLEEAAECASLLVNRAAKPIPSGLATYKEVRAIIDQIENCDFFKRRTNFHLPNLGKTHVPDNENSITNAAAATADEPPSGGSGGGVGGPFGGSTMTNGKGSYESDFKANMPPADILAAAAQSQTHIGLVAEEQQTIIAGAAAVGPYGPVSFVPVGMNAVYQMPVPNIYTQAALPIATSQMVYASSAVDMKKAPISEVKKPVVSLQQQHTVAKGDEAWHHQVAAAQTNLPTQAVGGGGDLPESTEDDLSGFQDVRSSRSKSRREKTAQQPYRPSGGGGGEGFSGRRAAAAAPAAAAAGKLRGRGGGRASSGPAFRGRKAGGFNQDSSDRFNNGGGGGGFDGTIGRWEDQDVGGSGGGGHRGTAGGGGFANHGHRGPHRGFRGQPRHVAE